MGHNRIHSQGDKHGYGLESTAVITIVKNVRQTFSYNGEIDIGDSVRGSQSLITSTNSVQLLTLMLVVITVSPSVSVPVATPAQ